MDLLGNDDEAIWCNGLLDGPNPKHRKSSASDGRREAEAEEVMFGMEEDD